MRTAITVHAATIIAIQSSESVVLVRPDYSTISCGTGNVSVPIGPGEYLAVTTYPITVSGDYVEVKTLDFREPWPDPPQVAASSAT
jgi:hypothetical protein